VSLIAFWDSIPGTLRRDEFGNAHGTGRKTYHYAGGAVQLVEDYRRGELVRSEWFRPDGTSVQVTEWREGSGEWLKLRDDGTVDRRMPFVAGRVHGEATYYAEDGSVLGVAEFKEGIRVGGYDPRGPRL
jgi:antitoxin component YwqK of YwqJK toxin-antitoxin module